MQKQAFFEKFEIHSDIFPRIENSTICYDIEPIGLPSNPISSLHYHNLLEIGLCYEGSGIFYNNLTSECISEGDIVIFFPGEPHYSQSLSRKNPCMCRFIFIDVVPNLFSLLKENKPAINLLALAQSHNIPSIIRKSEYPKIHTVLSNLILDVFGEYENIDFLASLHLTEFLVKVPAFFKKRETLVESEIKDSNDIIYIAESFISSHYNEPLNILQICEVCGISESQLRRRFKKTFGTSPLSYLHKLRCSIGAQLLLHTNLTINKISQKIGYIDSSEFYKHFHSLYNCSPSSYKKDN